MIYSPISPSEVVYIIEVWSEDTITGNDGLGEDKTHQSSREP